MGDHLTAQQTGSGYTVLGQHPLTDSSSGVYSRSTATSWTAQNAASTISLPHTGKVGTYLIDLTSAKTLRVVDDNSAFTAGTYGITLECVAITITTGYNFFGGPWSRGIVAVWGPFAYNIQIELHPVNDGIGDTAGRARIVVGNVGGPLISTRDVSTRPIISDGLPHHLALTHAATGTSNVVKLYVDGVLSETVTTTGELANLDANTLTAGVDDYFTGFDGSISHMCLTQDVLPVAEIQTRANYVRVMPHAKVVAWDSASNAWRAPRGSSGSSWLLVKPPS